MARPREELERALARLRAAPPRSFTAERNAAARALKASGDPASAAQVAKLRKPTRSVWTANALAREEPQRVRELLDVGAQLQQAQRRALAGAAGELHTANEAVRRALEAAVERGAALLQAAGERATDAVRQQLRDTLLASATGDEALREHLRAGALVEDLSPAGFGPAFAHQAVPLVRPTPRPRARKKPEKQSPAREAGEDPRARKRAREAAERALAAAQRAYAQAEAHVEDAESRAREARRGADLAQAALHAAREALHHLQ